MATSSLLQTILPVVFFAILLTGTNGERCSTSSIQVETFNSGVIVTGGDTVFEVEVKNLCPCAVRNVQLDARGFATTVDVDPAVFRADDGGVFLVNGGEPIASMATVRFQYAWDHFFQMTPGTWMSTARANS
ncbi:hypothetical protein HU200_000704 [Digitaria exilis]|uniref:Uncharacterized protein n=1 Tax=Digitaria exilis TaxID=1010633 RepID=A0A835G1R9_9POAL|nr:hypothetical protein HU200_000704 [Digitaria exilis]